MSQDCQDYKSCANQEQITLELKNDDINLGIVGCWGVYCQNDEVYFNTYCLDDNRIDELWDKEDLILNDFMLKKNNTKIRGQKSLVNSLKKFQPFTSLFLAGDNIYEYSEISDKLEKKLKEDIEKWKDIKEKTKEKFKQFFITNDIIKKDRKEIREMYKNLDIKLQFSKSFGECFKNLVVYQYFLALGNHDIETCDILNYQMNYENVIPSTYYNVLYKDNKGNDILNVFVLDTNLFESSPKDCAGQKYPQEITDQQIEWFYRTLNKSNSKYNIVVGHIPYKAIGHKSKDFYIYNKNLQPIFDIIKESNKERKKVQAYFCADEHDQQVLYDRTNNLHLIIIGSGGTALDQIFGFNESDPDNKENHIKIMNKLKEENLEFEIANSNFGFANLKISKFTGLEIGIIDVKTDLIYTIPKI